MLLAILFPLTAAACLGTELTLTLAVLPQLLNLPCYSALGVAVSLAPTAAAALLDMVIGRLFEQQWRRLANASSSWRKAAVVVVLGAVMPLRALHEGGDCRRRMRLRRQVAWLRSDCDQANRLGEDAASHARG